MKFRISLCLKLSHFSLKIGTDSTSLRKTTDKDCKPQAVACLNNMHLIPASCCYCLIHLTSLIIYYFRAEPPS